MVPPRFCKQPIFSENTNDSPTYLLSCLNNGFTTTDTTDLVQNLLDIPGPDERFGMGVVEPDEVFDDSHRLRKAFKDPAADLLAGDLHEPLTGITGAGHGAVEDALRATNRQGVPLRLQSWVRVLQRPFFIGNPGWVRSRG